MDFIYKIQTQSETHFYISFSRHLFLSLEGAKHAHAASSHSSYDTKISQPICFLFTYNVYVSEAEEVLSWFHKISYFCRVSKQEKILFSAEWVLSLIACTFVLFVNILTGISALYFLLDVSPHKDTITLYLHFVICLWLCVRAGLRKICLQRFPVTWYALLGQKEIHGDFPKSLKFDLAWFDFLLDLKDDRRAAVWRKGFYLLGKGSEIDT